jgi:hypothetical protein
VVTVTKQQKDLLKTMVLETIAVIDVGREKLYKAIFPPDEKPEWCNCPKCGGWHHRAKRV